MCVRQTPNVLQNPISRNLRQIDVFDGRNGLRTRSLKTFDTATKCLVRVDNECLISILPVTFNCPIFLVMSAHRPILA